MLNYYRDRRPGRAGSPAPPRDPAPGLARRAQRGRGPPRPRRRHLRGGVAAPPGPGDGRARPRAPGGPPPLLRRPQGGPGGPGRLAGIDVGRRAVPPEAAGGDGGVPAGPAPFAPPPPGTEEQAMSAHGHVLERTVLIRARARTVFRYFTDSERFAAWWGAGSAIEARPGGPVRIRYPSGV